MSTNQNPNEETLKFEIDLSATHWGKLPQFSIWLDEGVVSQSEVGAAVHTFKFERALAEGNHTLSIRLENKDQRTDTVVENGEIVKDMLLNIDDIRIDDISIGPLMWTAEYRLDQPQQFKGNTIDHLDNCVNLGWNGTYTLRFTSPFYVWLLEHL